MKINYGLLVAFLLLLFNVTYSYAQRDTIANLLSPKKAYLKLGLNFISNNVYLGRSDTVGTPTLSPSVKYSFKNGLYLSGDLDIITNRPKNKLDGGNVEVGYDYIGDGNLDWGASLTKLFFNANSTQVSSSISSELNAYVDYDLAEIITPLVSISYQIAKSGGTGDILLNPGLSHDFLMKSIFGNDDKLLISPQAGLNAGTQNFYSEYLIRKGKLNRKTVNAAYANYDNQLAKFTLLDYEVSIPLVYIAGKFSLTFIPTYAFAQDSLPKSTAAEKLITTAVEKTQPFKTSIFYIETGVSIKF